MLSAIQVSAVYNNLNNPFQSSTVLYPTHQVLDSTLLVLRIQHLGEALKHLGHLAAQRLCAGVLQEDLEKEGSWGWGRAGVGVMEQ